VPSMGPRTALARAPLKRRKRRNADREKYLDTRAPHISEGPEGAMTAELRGSNQSQESRRLVLALPAFQVAATNRSKRSDARCSL
jgi:hypothetical protein